MRALYEVYKALEEENYVSIRLALLAVAILSNTFFTALALIFIFSLHDPEHLPQLKAAMDKHMLFVGLTTSIAVLLPALVQLGFHLGSLLRKRREFYEDLE